jgi:hypothetical protein
MSTARPVAPDIQRFFERLYPDVGEGWLVLSHPDPTRRTRQGKPALRSDWCDVSQRDWAAIAYTAAQRAQHYTVYFGVAVQHPSCTPEPWQRSKSATAYVVPGVWCDLDLAYGQHAASALPQTDQEALDFLGSLPAVPSLIVHSGGGLYGYWLFREPFTITTIDELHAITHLSKQFSQTIVTHGNAHGWTLDALGDLARVLRPPGTINHKYGKRVALIQETTARYALEDFHWLLDLPRPARHQRHDRVPLDGQPAVVQVAAHYGAELREKSRTELAGAHPQHGSSTGDNFNVNADRGLWHCWRHGTGGDALSLIAVCEHILPCEHARPGALTGDSFRRVVALAHRVFGTRPSLLDQVRPAWTGARWHDTDTRAALEVTLWH